MALADTARLVASLELQDKFSGPARKAEGSIGSLDKKMSTLGGSAKKLGAGIGSAVGTLAKIGVGVAAGGIALLTVNIKAGVEALAALEAEVVQTETVIKSTGGAAGQSAKDIRLLSEQFEGMNAAMDDVAIQGGANMLLTFTNIKGKAFEPALEAILDINQAMGGGEGGLQKVAIQVGKALNDPAAGVSKLTRLGVTFTDQQKEQIKALQESGDLLGAQQVILEELGKEFGGQFANAGKTAEGRMAKLGDTIQDLQKRLAGPLLPAIDRVREKLISILSTDRAGQAAEKIGTAIASIFTQPNIDAASSKIGGLLDKISGLDTGKLEEGGGLLANVSDTLSGMKSDGTLGSIGSSIKGIAESLAKLPWASIGDAARLLGTGSKALLDAFLGLPPWVQTAVLTGWGLNKLTGGAITGVLGSLVSTLAKAVIGIKANTVIVQGTAVTGAGGGVPAAAGRGAGGILTTVKNFGALASIPLTIVAAEMLISELGNVAEQAEDTNKKLDNLPRDSADELETSIGKVQGAIDVTNQNIVGGFLGLTRPVLDRLEQEKTQLVNLRDGVRYASEQERRATVAVGNKLDLERSAANAYRSADATRIQSLRDSHSVANQTLRDIRAKKTTVNVTANIENTVNVSAANVQNAVQAYTFTTGGRAFVE